MNAFSAAVLLVLVAIPGFAQATGEIRGCARPSQISKGIRRVVASDWSTLSLESIQAQWPTKLQPAECANGSCRSIKRDGRVLEDRRECGEKVDLDLPLSDQGSHSLTVAVYYSAAQKAKVLAAADLFLRAAGVSKEDMLKPRQVNEKFSWKGQDGSYRNVTTHVWKQEGIWTLFFRVEMTSVPARQ